MRLPRFNPITRKRIQRFKRIKRGYYSFLILTAATVASLFSNFIANSRAIVVRHEGKLYFPTYKFHDMETFGQDDEYGFTDAEARYRRLKDEVAEAKERFAERMETFDGTEAALIQAEPALARKNDWVLMPPIPFDPYENDFEFYDEPAPNAPDSRHLLGTDSQGRDVVARLLYGFRISIMFALALVSIAQVFGLAIGSLQGYLGGTFDIVSQRFIEIWSTLPFLYVVVVLATFFTPSFRMLLGIMLLFEWISITFYMRTETYREKSREYCTAARSMGGSHFRVIFKHLLPNCLTPLVTLTPFQIVGAILSLTALDFLGYGLPAPTASWGEMIDQAMQSANRDKLWLSLSPFCAISVTLILVTMIGESVREAVDPKQFSKYR